LLIGQGASLAAAFPYHIAYANEFMDAHSKYSLMYSYNWDLGQDMKRLAELAREKGWQRVKLLSGQRTDPYFYGLSWQPWTLKDFRQPQPGTVYVMDASILTDRTYAKLCFEQDSWLYREGMDKTVGGTLVYYETPGTWGLSSRDDSPIVNSFPYYKNGIQPYLSHEPPDSWIDIQPFDGKLGKSSTLNPHVITHFFSPHGVRPMSALPKPCGFLGNGSPQSIQALEPIMWALWIPPFPPKNTFSTFSWFAPWSSAPRSSPAGGATPSSWTRNGT
jgi:hypothetical protein